MGSKFSVLLGEVRTNRWHRYPETVHSQPAYCTAIYREWRYQRL